MVLDRPEYIERILPFLDKPVVKVITGMRRVGKSRLLELIRHRLDIDRLIAAAIERGARARFIRPQTPR